MPELLCVYLDRPEGKYRWVVLYSTPGVPEGRHLLAIAHSDSEEAARQLGKLIDSVVPVR
jgi:hypothetical protein